MTYPHPWLRLALAIRAMTSERWGDQWPMVKAELINALRLKAAMARASWWN